MEHHTVLNTRLKIWNWILKISKHPEAQILPLWLQITYGLLYPLQFFYWRMNNYQGYQLRRDIWLIHGYKFSGKMMRHFSIGGDETFRILKRDDDVITIERTDT